MNFKIKRIKLLNALSKTTKAVSIRSPLPVLTGIKFCLLYTSIIYMFHIKINTQIKIFIDLFFFNKIFTTIN